MAAEKIMALNAYFDEKMAEHSARRAELAADLRSAEADFEKIKYNVYDIFKTVLSAAGKAYNEDGEIGDGSAGGEGTEVPTEGT